MSRNQAVLKRAVALACGFALMAALFAGCGGKSNAPAPSDASAASAAAAKQTAAKEPPFKITILTQLYTDPPSADNRFIKAVEEETNTTLDITWAPSASFTDKFTMTIASGQMPMALLISDDRHGAYINACKQGAFWDISPYLKEYLKLVGASQTMWDNARVDGKNYIIPRAREIGRAGLIYRSDWLDNLGMKVPTNIDELYAMLKAFTLNDPDKNGKNDTFGFVMDQAGGAKDKTDIMLSTVASYFGASTSWGADDKGTVRPAFEEKEFIDSLKWLRKMYEEKIINQDFAVVQDVKTVFAKGNAGCYSNTNDDINAPQFLNDLPKNIPGAKVEAIIKINGPKGIRAPYWGTGYFGGYAFAKSAVKSEADLKKILAFWEKINDAKLLNLFAYGQENKDYVMKEGKVSYTPEQRTKFSTDYGSIGQLAAGAGDAGKLLQVLDGDMRTANYRAEVQKFVVPNPIISFISPTFTNKGADLNKIVLDARVKFIMGAIDEAGYADMVKKWYSSGGDKVCEEYAAELAKLKK